MPACGQLSKGQAAPCEPAVAGLKQKQVLIRYDDLAGFTRNAINRKAVTLSLAAGKKGFVFEGIGPSNAGRTKLNTGKFVKTYTHEMDMVAFGLQPEELATAEDLAKDKVVSVVRDNNGMYRVYGLNAGLEATKGDTDSQNEDTGGAPELTLVSSKEKGHFDYLMLFDEDGAYDPAATKLAFDALYAA